jgi:hypothetical protein
MRAPRPALIGREDAATLLRLMARNADCFADAARWIHLADALQHHPEALRCRDESCRYCAEARA